MDLETVEILQAMVEDQARGKGNSNTQEDETENTVECGSLFDAREE